jgi:HK97 family phage major capsid protein
MAVPVEDRDEEKLVSHLGKMKSYLDSDEAKGLAALDAIAEAGGIDALRAELDQIKADNEAAQKEVRNLKRRQLIEPGKIFTPMGRDGRLRFRFPSNEMAEAFAKFCLDVRAGKLGEYKDVTVADGTGGAFLLPMPEMSDLITRGAEMVGVAERIATIVPMGAAGWSKPRGLASAVAYWKAAGTAATESSPTFGRMELSGTKTLIALVDADMEISGGEMAALGNYLANQFIYAIGRATDQAAFLGDGSPTYNGIYGVLNSDRVTVVTMDTADDAFADLAWGDLVDLEANVSEESLANARYLMHRTIKALVKKLQDSSNMPIWQPPAGAEPGLLNGYPVEVAGTMRASSASAASTKFMAFGDFARGLYIGQRGSIAVEFSDHAGFKNLQRVWRAYVFRDVAVDGYTSGEITSNSDLVNPIAVLSTNTG